jgi:hypothetical protein
MRIEPRLEVGDYTPWTLAMRRHPTNRWKTLCTESLSGDLSISWRGHGSGTVRPHCAIRVDSLLILSYPFLSFLIRAKILTEDQSLALESEKISANKKG